MLEIDWDSAENIAQIRTTVALVKKGCGCKTGCVSARCKCRKQGNHCGPGCKCLRCCSLPVLAPANISNINETSDESSSEEELSTENMYEELENEVDQIMDTIFGGTDCDFIMDVDTISFV